MCSCIRILIRIGVVLRYRPTRFPRIHRWRKDKKPEDVDDLETIRGYAGMSEIKEVDGKKIDASGNLLLF